MWIALAVFAEDCVHTCTCYACAPHCFLDQSVFHILWPDSCAIPRGDVAEVERKLQPVLQRVPSSVLGKWSYKQAVTVVLGDP